MTDKEDPVSETVVSVSRTITPSREDLERAIETIKAAVANGVVSEEDARTPQLHHTHLIGPAAAATGHGLGAGGRRKAKAKAYEEFIDNVRSLVGPTVWSEVDVEEQAAWVRIQGRGTGERVYIARTVNTVSRVESTLPPEVVPGCMKPDKQNGSILSWVPAVESTVAEVVVAITTHAGEKRLE